MPQESIELLRECRKHYKKNQFNEVIKLLNDLSLDYQNVELVIVKSEALLGLNNIEESISTLNIGLKSNPQNIQLLLALATNYKRIKDYDKLFIIYDEILQIDPQNLEPVIGLTISYYEMGDFAKALEYASKLVKQIPYSYYGFYIRALIYSNIKQYTKSLSDYNQSIRLHPGFAEGYFRRSNIWEIKKQHKKALKDLNKAIDLDPNEKIAYYQRARLYDRFDDHKAALMDYEKFVFLEDNKGDYRRKLAVFEIERLQKKIDNIWYDNIDKIVVKVKELLLFENDLITHYTSMSAASQMILHESPFRISEGSFLNDTSEGRELFNFLKFQNDSSSNIETISRRFTERPFIASFVSDSKHNDLALWRMYGKENQQEAKGCSLTLVRQSFLDSITKRLLNPAKKNTSSDDLSNFDKIDVSDSAPIRKLSDNQADIAEVHLFYDITNLRTDQVSDRINYLYGLDRVDLKKGDQKFDFYNVAYLLKGDFVVPDGDPTKNKTLNLLMNDLKTQIKTLNDVKRNQIVGLLNEIAYLFKSAEYQYEHEVRLVVKGTGIKKNIDINQTPPRVFIELIKVSPLLNSVVLGPKVEKADEWAAAFNYHIGENLPDDKKNVQIIISHIPFK